MSELKMVGKCEKYEKFRCAWGCRGQFMPARYNSSRAKCIKCSFCRFCPKIFILFGHFCAASSSRPTSLSSTLIGWQRVESIFSLMQPTSTPGGDTSDCLETLQTRSSTRGRMSRCDKFLFTFSHPLTRQCSMEAPGRGC